MVYWITNQIGTAAKGEEIPPNVWMIKLYNQIADGWNPPEQIYLIAKEALSMLYNGDKVVFVCHAGISRSSALATLVLAYFDDGTWEYAYGIVRFKCPRAPINPKYNLMKSCVEALKLLRNRSNKRCPICSAPIESWEEKCIYCWKNWGRFKNTDYPRSVK